MQRLFTAAVLDRESTLGIEYFWAEDDEHASEQAWNANPDSATIVIREVIPRITLGKSYVGR